jgi:hypothetical protein
MKSKSYFRDSDGLMAIAGPAADEHAQYVEAERYSASFQRLEPALLVLEKPKFQPDQFQDALTRTFLTLVDLAEDEESVRMEAALDDELMQEIAAAYDIDAADEGQRKQLSERVRNERIWSQRASWRVSASER